VGRFFRVFRSCLEEELAGHRIEWRYTRQLSYRLVDRRLRRSEQNYLINHAGAALDRLAPRPCQRFAENLSPLRDSRGRGGRHRPPRAVANALKVSINGVGARI